MVTEVILPVLGETMDKGRIIKWFAQEGQSVEKGEPLYQIETDKAVLDVEAPASGLLRRVLYETDAEVPVLSVVAVIAGPDEDLGKYSATQGASSGVTTVVAAEEVAAHNAEAPRHGPKHLFASPRARKIAAEQGVELGLVQGSGPGGRIVERDVLDFARSQVVQKSGPAEFPATTPTARKAAATVGLGLGGLHGTGPGGRITRADVEAATAVRPVRTAAVTSQAPAIPGERLPLTGVRRIIAERMSASSRATARVTLTTEVDASRFVQIRSLLKQQLEPQLGFAISYTDILVAVAARALSEHRHVNVRLTDEGIEMLSSINIGVAVDAERGLLVPVVRDADKKGIASLAVGLRELVSRARDGKSMPDDLSGGTFTLTNLGMYDIDAFTPIINLPECAILGVGRIRERPVVCDGEVCVRPMMVLSLSFDHRLVDGAPAARFLQRIKELIEQPFLLLA
jgi:pyruvate dehydrogenase E2 component (dihydrolipoamide acetyltransferase)